LLVACISRITGDMVLSRSPQGKAFGATFMGNLPASPADLFGPPTLRAKPPHRVARRVGSEGPRSPAQHPDAGRPATSRSPASAIPISAISLIGPQPVDLDLVDGIPGEDSVPEAGQAGPGSGPPAGLPPGDIQNVPPGAGGPPGGGPGQPPPAAPPGGGPGAPPPVAPPGGPPGGGGPPVPPPVVGVPEPSTWSMFVLALLAIGVPLRRSRRGTRFGS
jgi:hypothetical protein